MSPFPLESSSISQQYLEYLPHSPSSPKPRKSQMMRQCISRKENSLDSLCEQSHDCIPYNSSDNPTRDGILHTSARLKQDLVFQQSPQTCTSRRPICKSLAFQMCVFFSTLIVFTVFLPYHTQQYLHTDLVISTKVQIVSYTVDFIFSMCGIVGVEEPGAAFNRKLFELINPRVSESFPAFSGHVRTRDIVLDYFVGNETIAKHNARRIAQGEIDIEQDLRVRVFEPNAKFYRVKGKKLPLMVFFHGGGFVLQHVWDLEQTRVCLKFARYGPMIVVAIEYRLAPEHPYPANIEDMKAVMDWLARERSHYRTSNEAHGLSQMPSEDERYITNYDDDHLSHVPYSLIERLKALFTGSIEEYRGNIRKAEAWRYFVPQNIDWDRIIFAGDSAGGQLAASCALYIKEKYPHILPFVKQQILIYPTFALVNTESKRIYANSPVLNEGVMRFFIHAYAGFNQTLIFEEILRDPYVNPMLSQHGLGGMPPAFFVIAGLDPLQDDSKIYARQLQRTGVPIRVLMYPKHAHGFFTMSFFSESEMAMHEILDHMRVNGILT